MTDFATLLRLLVKHNIDFIIIGGAAVFLEERKAELTPRVKPLGNHIPL
ncbi:MAG TPA: hypothetical protein VN647_04450 [Nitrospira sp.]|nr:hypothetical protein [Nitrospira sp.]